MDNIDQIEFVNNQQLPCGGIVGDCGANQIWNEKTCKCEDIKKEESSAWKYILGIGAVVMVGED